MANPVYRTNYFIAKQGQGNGLAEALQPIIGSIRTLEGCLLCEMFQSHDNNDLILVFEHWDSVDAHQAAAKHVKPADFHMVMGFLADTPAGNYFTRVA